LAEREAAGESFWTEEFGDRPRTRIRHLFIGVSRSWPIYAEHARVLILEDEGLHYLSGSGLLPRNDFLLYLGQCADDMMPTVLEATNEALLDQGLFTSTYEQNSEKFVEGANEILREERISWEFVDNQMTPFSSRELHSEVVIPTLRLLASSGWEQVEAAYQDALGELAAGRAPDAITDAGTALQEALTLLGAEGNALGPLIRSAKKKGIILGHDQNLLDTLSAAATWVSADRSQVGDAHQVSGASSEDAWLTVHVVGAILLRLSAGSARPS